MAATLRPARTSDVPAIAELWKEMWDAQASRDPRLASGPMADVVIGRWMEEWLASDRARLIVAEEDGALAGYALGMIVENPPIALAPMYGYIADVAVTAKSRLHGLGRRLVEALLEWFRSNRLPYVQVQVAVRNDAGRAFWRRVGFGEFLEMLRMEIQEA